MAVNSRTGPASPCGLCSGSRCCLVFFFFPPCLSSWNAFDYFWLYFFCLVLTCSACSSSACCCCCCCCCCWWWWWWWWWCLSIVRGIWRESSSVALGVSWQGEWMSESCHCRRVHPEWDFPTLCEVQHDVPSQSHKQCPKRCLSFMPPSHKGIVCKRHWDIPKYRDATEDPYQ